MNFPTPSAESGMPAAFLTTSTLNPKRSATTATSAAGGASIPNRSERAIRSVGATGVPPENGAGCGDRRPATAPLQAQVLHPRAEASLAVSLLFRGADPLSAWDATRSRPAVHRSGRARAGRPRSAGRHAGLAPVSGCSSAAVELVWSASEREREAAGQRDAHA